MAGKDGVAGTDGFFVASHLALLASHFSLSPTASPLILAAVTERQFFLPCRPCNSMLTRTERVGENATVDMINAMKAMKKRDPCISSLCEVDC